MKSVPEISIITVCLNAVNVIEHAVKTVLDQTFSNLEYIIIDGGSTDGTVEILKKYSSEKRIKFISEKDNGIYDAMNKGVKMACGNWIYFLGSDDVFMDRNTLENVFKNPHENIEIIYGNVKFLHSGAIYDGPFSHEKISQKNICHQALFTRKSVFEKLGMFNLKYKMSADFAFNLKWMGLNFPALHIDQTIVIYNEKGLSGTIWDQQFYNDFDNLLIENNIISTRSFLALKKKYNDVINSVSYKTGKALIAPASFLKNKISGLKK